MKDVIVNPNTDTELYAFVQRPPELFESFIQNLANGMRLYEAYQSGSLPGKHYPGFYNNIKIMVQKK